MPRLMRDWTETLTIRQQAVLVAAVRGCDGAPKDDPSKSLLWALRWDVCNPSEEGVDPKKTKTFMGYTSTLNDDVDRFLHSLDQYPFHFVMHVAHACEILGYKHPVQGYREFWRGIYLVIVTKNLHCLPETEAMMDDRLADR